MKDIEKTKFFYNLLFNLRGKSGHLSGQAFG